MPQPYADYLHRDSWRKDCLGGVTMTVPKTVAEQIADFEAAAKQCGISQHQICVAARINHKLWLYWKSDVTRPPADIWRAARIVIADLIEASDPGPTEMQVP